MDLEQSILSPDFLRVVVSLESPDISFCSLSNKLLEAIFGNWDPRIPIGKDVFRVLRFLSHVRVCGNPPG